MQVIGRERELAVLEGALERALSGAGGIVAVSGEPGIGKTTLARALRAHADETDVPVLWGRGVESGAPVLWPWRQAVAARRHVVGDAAVRAEAGSAAPELACVAPELQPALAVEPAVGDVERVQLFEAVAGFLGAAAADSGLLVVLDDMQWADRASLHMLEHLAEGLLSSRVLLVVGYRTAGTVDDVLAILDGVSTTARMVVRGRPPTF